MIDLCDFCHAPAHHGACAELLAYTEQVKARMTDDATLVELMAIRTKIAECRQMRLYLTANTLRHRAMSLVECFVDPEWQEEQNDLGIPTPTLRSSLAMSLERETLNGIPVPF